MQKTFERVEVEAKHKQPEKNVENLSIVESKSKHEDVRRQLLPKSRQHFRLAMHGEIVVHSNVNLSTPRLATCVIYFVPFRCCLLIQPDAKLILIDFMMEIKNLGEKCHSCLEA